MGTAHLVADQFGPDGQGLPFNSERVPRVRDKYFIAYLLALLQRMALHRALADSAEITAHSARLQGRGHAAAPTPGPLNSKQQIAHQMGHLRDSLLEFAVGGHFTQVSSRQSVHRFYRLSRDGLDVAPAWAEVRRAISDMEAKHSIAHERDVAQSMAKSLHVVAEVQTKVEVIECFIISVYFAELCNMIFEAIKEGMPDYFKWVHLTAVIVVAAVALLASRAYLLSSDHASDDSVPHEDSPRTRQG
jgi:hypothetical protein